jgi:hypothetical protein
VYSDSRSLDLLEARTLLFYFVRWYFFIMERLIHYIVDGKWGIPFTDEVVLERERAWRAEAQWLTPAEREAAERGRSKLFVAVCLFCFVLFFFFFICVDTFIVLIRHDAANSDGRRRPRRIEDAPWSEKARATGEPEFMSSMKISFCVICCVPDPPSEEDMKKKKITLSQRFTGLNPQDIPYEIPKALY